MTSSSFPYNEASFTVEQATTKCSRCCLCGSKVAKKTRVSLWKGITIVGAHYVTKYLCNRGKGTSSCYQVLFPHKKNGFNLFQRVVENDQVSLKMWKSEGLVDWQSKTWEFTSILDHSKYYFYKIKWSDGSVTWEPESNIEDSEYLEKYKTKKKLKDTLPQIDNNLRTDKSELKIIPFKSAPITTVSESESEYSDDSDDATFNPPRSSPLMVRETVKLDGRLSSVKKPKLMKPKPAMSKKLFRNRNVDKIRPHTLGIFSGKSKRKLNLRDQLFSKLSTKFSL